MDYNQKIKYIEKIHQKLSKNIENCMLCPRGCQVNRIKNEKGYCGQEKDIKIYSSFLHFGEEPPISGKRGSGTIFFSGCSLKCIYCQNYKFSQLGNGRIMEEGELAKIMLDLEKKGGHNINLVTPTHFLPQILGALKTALKKGLKLPIVYNSSGYEKKEIVETVAPIIDSWLIDFKYINRETAQRYSNSPEYPAHIQKTCQYLYQQQKAANKLTKGQIPPMIVRHLILPNHIQESIAILNWVSKNTPKILVSIMSQYQPYFKAKNISKINRTLTKKEYDEIKKVVETFNLKGWLQEFKTKKSLAGIYFRP